MIDQAREILGLDLTLNLVVNNKSLLSTKFSNNNINLFGTKLMDTLFTKDEMKIGTIDPTKKDAVALDNKKISLIKSNI